MDLQWLVVRVQLRVQGLGVRFRGEMNSGERRGVSAPSEFWEGLAFGVWDWG